MKKLPLKSSLKPTFVWLCAGTLLVGCATGPVDNIPSAAEAGSDIAVGSAPGAGAIGGTDTFGTDQSLFDAEGMVSSAVDGVDVGRSFGSDAFFDREAIFDAGSPLSQRVFYFEYDRDTLSDQYLDTITDHGRYLATYPESLVRLEGHADERGTREYNIALAERRAQAVKRLMMLQGASYNQIITISYGEEQPAVLGQTDDAYSRNRRVELVYE